MNKLDFLILIDNGHGSNTSGKCSPDKRLREYAWCREVAQMIVDKLTALGYNAKRIVTETTDISISTRVNRVNALCKSHGASKCLLISVHNNAGPGLSWSTAKGWLSIVDDACSANAKKLANILFDEAKAAGLKMRQYTPNQKWYLYHQALGCTAKKRLGILKSTACPAVLTENLFQNNREECDYLLSDEGKATLRDVHVNAIIKYIDTFGK